MNISNIIYKQDIMHHIPGHLLWQGCIISAFFLYLLTSLVLSGEPGDRCKDFGSIRLRHTIAHHTNPQLILLTSHPDLYIINERKTKYYPQKLFHSKTVYSQKIKVWTKQKKFHLQKTSQRVHVTIIKMWNGKVNILNNNGRTWVTCQIEPRDVCFWSELDASLG